MSEPDGMKIAEALNAVKPEYIDEYLTASEYIMNKRLNRRRKFRRAAAIAASLAVVSLMSFGIIRASSDGLLNGSGKSSMDGTIDFANKVSEACNADLPVNGKYAESTGGYYTDEAGDLPDYYLQVSCSGIESNAPAAGIEVSVLSCDCAKLVLTFKYGADAVNWYTGTGIIVTDISNGDETTVYESTEDNMDFLLDGSITDSFVYSWMENMGVLTGGTYRITTYLSDGTTTYEVYTILCVE